MKDYNTIPWDNIYENLNESGYVLIPNMLNGEECASLKSMYPEDERYRNIISMERYRFGKGEYKYFSYPLPKPIQDLRASLYPPIATLANQWMENLSIEIFYPSIHSEFIKQCHDQGQARPTPLILKYEAGGYNTLHQDLYGQIFFPFQVVFLLSDAEKEFEGGEFLLLEQIPRAQSKGQVMHLKQGDALIFTTNFRPVLGAKGFYKANVKHGVSPVISGQRFALGIIFHDAK